jgi:hypothetical protein
MNLPRFAAVATAGLLAAAVLPVAAQAADSLQAGGLVIPGTALRVGVSGAAGYAGSIQARFTATDSALFWGDPTHTSANSANMNDETAAMFALQVPGGVYSPAYHGYGGNSLAFTQTSAPVLTGSGTVGAPWTVTSAFDATSTLHVTQTVTHVDGTTEFLGSWAIQNTGGGAVALKAFEGADLYVNGNDNGVGALTGASPNRIVQSVASDGTAAELVEQAATPWTHFFSGANGPFYNAMLFSNFSNFVDIADPVLRDSGEASEWDFPLGAGATQTLSVMWRFTQPSPPQAPVLANLPAPLTTQTSIAPTFSPHAGDTHVVGYECSLDAAVYTACTSPVTRTGLADGPHTFAVRGLNSAGIPGPATTTSWTVDTTAPVAPSVSTAPPALTRQTAATIVFAGETGSTFQCSVDDAAYAACASPLQLTGLANGPHSVSVRQTDALGHVANSLATIAWTVDTTLPDEPTSAPADTPDPPRTCVSTRTMRLHWSVAGGTRLRAFEIIVNGRSRATLAGSKRAFTLSLRGRPAQKVRVQIRAKTKAGARFGTTRNYVTCSTSRLPGKLQTLRIKPLL